MSIGRLSPRCAMNHRAKLGLTSGGRHVPLCGRDLNQHVSSGRAATAHHVEKAAHRMRSIIVLVAVALVGIRLLDLDLGPVRIEFISQDQGQRGADAGAHFGTRRNDRNRLVGLDSNEYVWPQHRILRARAGRGGLRPENFGDKRRTEHQRAG